MVVVSAATELNKLLATRHKILREIRKIDKNPIKKWNILFTYYILKRIALKKKEKHLYEMIVDLKKQIKGFKK